MEINKEKQVVLILAEQTQYRVSTFWPRNKAVWDSAKTAFVVGGDAVADSDGKFTLELPPGKYVLWTFLRSIGEQRLSWCKAFEVQDSPVKLIVNQDSVLLYENEEKIPSEATRLRGIATELGLK